MKQTRILLIDSDVEQLFLTKARLQGHSDALEVEIAVNNEEAVEKIRTHRYDCIVRSVPQRSNTDGLALSNTLSSIFNDLPVIHLKGNQSVEDEAHSNVLNLNSDTLMDDLVEQIYTLTRSPVDELESEEPDSNLIEIQRAFSDPSSTALLLSSDGVTVERCNANAEKIFKPDHFVGTSFQHIPLALLMAQKDRGRMRQFVWQLCDGGPDREEFTFVDSEMEQVTFLVCGICARLNGSLLKILLTLEPVS